MPPMQPPSLMIVEPVSATPPPPQDMTFEPPTAKWGKVPQPPTKPPPLELLIKVAAAAAETPAHMEIVRAAALESQISIPGLLPSPPSGSRPESAAPTAVGKEDEATSEHVERKTSANAEEAERHIPQGDADSLPSAPCKPWPRLRGTVRRQLDEETRRIERRWGREWAVAVADGPRGRYWPDIRADQRSPRRHRGRGRISRSRSRTSRNSRGDRRRRSRTSRNSRGDRQRISRGRGG